MSIFVSYLFYNSFSLWSCQIYWWKWRYLHQHEVTMQLPLLHVRIKAEQVRLIRSSPRTWDAYVWATEFSLGPPKCQARRYHCSNYTQRRPLMVPHDLGQSGVFDSQGKYCKHPLAMPGYQPKTPIAFLLYVFFSAVVSSPYHTPHEST